MKSCTVPTSTQILSAACWDGTHSIYSLISPFLSSRWVNFFPSSRPELLNASQPKMASLASATESLCRSCTAMPGFFCNTCSTGTSLGGVENMAQVAVGKYQMNVSHLSDLVGWTVMNGRHRRRMRRSYMY